MRHSIFSVILFGILLGAILFFMPHLIIGIFIILLIIRLLHVAFMGHGSYGRGYYGHGSGRECDYAYRYGRGYEPDSGCGTEYDREHDHHHKHHYDHRFGYGPMHEHLFYWVDKVRNMSEEEFTEFKGKMDKGFGHGYRGMHSDRYEKSNSGDKEKAENNSAASDIKEEPTK